jgi:excinuclease ABC subunit C
MPVPDVSYLKEKLRKSSANPGVYLMKDRLGAILYVGKARNLKKRLSSYFMKTRRQKIGQPKVAAMLDLIYDFETIEVRSEAEALLLESRLIKHWKPKYNTELVDDKRYPMIRVDVEGDMPRFRVTRIRTSEKSRYFGPFAFSSSMRKTLTAMRLQFGIMLGDASPTLLSDGRWKLYDDIRAELYGHANIVTQDEYRARVDAAMAFLEGKSREWLKNISSDMKNAADEMRYEDAALLRDLAKAVEATLEPTRKFAVLPQTEKSSDDIVESLGRVLGMKSPPARMECFDISHISGTFCVASMVSFFNGEPDKKNYRRFRIKSFVGNDDFRSMEEVVGRRYGRLFEEHGEFPDLIVIDGGAGQIASAMRALLEIGTAPPYVIGLAKQHERIFFANGRTPLDLPPDSEERKLLQRIRDEAHRFANTYNAQLRSRRIRESVLDDFEGMGPVRRHALFDKFKTIEKMKSATIKELAETDGVGLAMAERLAEFLSKC